MPFLKLSFNIQSTKPKTWASVDCYVWHVTLETSILFYRFLSDIACTPTSTSATFINSWDDCNQKYVLPKSIVLLLTFVKKKRKSPFIIISVPFHFLDLEICQLLLSNIMKKKNHLLTKAVHVYVTNFCSPLPQSSILWVYFECLKYKCVVLLLM